VPWKAEAMQYPLPYNEYFCVQLCSWESGYAWADNPVWSCGFESSFQLVKNKSNITDSHLEIISK